MLSSIGRAAVRRLAATPVATSSANVVAATWACRVPFRPARLCAARLYATAVSKPAKKPAAAAKTTSTKTKKPASTKAAAKPKKTAAKAKAKKPVQKAPRAKKPLSPEQQDIKLRRELKKKALYDTPRQLPESAWTVFLTQETRQALPSGGITKMMPEIAARFKALSSSEVSHFKEIGDQNKLLNSAKFKEWLAQYTPQQIVDANNARRTLYKTFNFPKGKYVHLIKDERLPKGPLNAYAFYHKARWASGEFNNHTTAPEASPIIGREWKSLSASDKQPYLDLAEADHERYTKEVRAIFGRDPRVRSSPSPST
ncbi:hypothetical protein JX265_005510 [Neoarthrinium moseri]|uniref:HMG box domain-containing protein n=1 Tax=Neoarthrinium moseri TaxID=1658444 RepID=A0A9Q0ARD7_9PEZI|nr:uncharacterized protein JN550_012649 [Neoarthrinium moseri]KAI1847430.1 hypothetical protein JX266_006655 [Neoarthrinium moseri]KAI1858439.1 hypothetical protein JN550_012649 [Neoarthrinium moseri]KAI1872630.1 hypothetical protein JX265_005510 [Neoarthrinium moseri]